MSKTDRPKPQFLEDTPNLADFIAERLKEIRKAEGRVAQEPGFVTQPVTESYGGFMAGATAQVDALLGPFGWWPSLKLSEIGAVVTNGRAVPDSAPNDTKEPDPYY